jgi:putative ABC transport system permease protein
LARFVVGEGLRLTIAGVAIGVAALALSRLMASILFGITSTDPLTFGLVAAGLVLVAPATKLRSE